MQSTAFGPEKPGPFIKLLRIMKISALLVLLVLQAAARPTASAQVTLKEAGAPLEKVLKAIKKQSAYDLFFDENLVKAKGRPVVINVNNVPVEEALRLVFKDQDNLSYALNGKIISIKVKEAPKGQPGFLNQGISPGDMVEASPANIEVAITVVAAENNQTLEGASVTVKGSNKGVATDMNGRAVLKDVDPNATIVISFTGYANQEVKLGGRNSLVVKLIVSANELQDVVINKGYYTEKQRLSTGNVARVTAKDIEKQPVNNPLLALQGRVPGVVITQNNGLPGGGIVVRIQGQNSIRNGNDPFYVIDGVPYYSQLLPNQGAILGNSGPGSNGATFSGNPLSYINPEDIESIEILKDADATAIYGSRAANGAILITTKKGKAGNLSVNVNIQSGWGKVTRKMDLLNTQQYLQMQREGYYNDNVTPTINGAPDLLFWDTTRNTDWQKELIGRTAQYNDAYVTLSGGNSNTQFLVGSGYHRETTVYQGDFMDKKGSVHFSLNSMSTDQKFRLQLNASYVSDNNLLPGQDLTQNSLQLSPNAPALYNTDGSLNWQPLTPGAFGTWSNPLRFNYLRYKSSGNNLVANAILSYKIVRGLEIKTNLGYTNLNTNDSKTSPLIFQDPAAWSQGNNLRTALYSNNELKNWIIEPQISYGQKIGRGRLESLLGITFQQNKSDGQLINASGFNSDLLLEDVKSASTITIVSTINSLYKYNAVFARLNYNLDNKYIINLTARRDGTSRFGPESQFHNFAAIGLSWVFSQENFVQKSLPFLSFGKLTTSYGSTGSDQIPDYSFMDLYRSFSVGAAYQGATPLVINNLFNPNIHWEETKKFNAGISLGFLKDRILVDAAYFRNRTYDQLLGYRLPFTTGFSSVFLNLPGVVQNTGWEFSLSGAIIKKDKISWSSSVNLTIPRNKLISFENIGSSSFGGLIGQPITSTLTYHFLGVDPLTGVYVVADKTSNPTSLPNIATDLNVVINTAPSLYGGFQNNIRFRGFELDFLFQFVKQNAFNYAFGSFPGNPKTNQPVWVLQAWKKPGDIATVQRMNANGGIASQYRNATSSDAAYEGASYARLKNISLSWQLPQKWKNAAHLQNARLFLQGQNLITITKYKGLDPENANINTLPNLKVLTFGAQITF